MKRTYHNKTFNCPEELDGVEALEDLGFDVYTRGDVVCAVYGNRIVAEYMKVELTGAEAFEQLTAEQRGKVWHMIADELADQTMHDRVHEYLDTMNLGDMQEYAATDGDV